MILRQFSIMTVMFLASIVPSRSETLVTDLSQHVIEITSQFAGSDLLLFGALERHATESHQSDEIAVQGLDYDIIIVVQSEPTDLIIRKKENVGGIWINNEDYIARSVPGYYVMGSTRPLNDFLSDEKQAEFGLGLKNLNITSESDSDIVEYKEALIRNMTAKGLYSESSGNVTVKDEILFRANLTFPSNMPVGKYSTNVYLVRDGDIILNDDIELKVDKQGIERVIYNFAHDYPPFYGIMAIIVAISAGLISGFVARKIS
ncbi:MAG: TIGR02186 family protein [Emcibacteraceae bacterium]|nr:TIGR02186 family protein [Emcibacteraceae bacterium]MDG1995021.1 TIGR02186 family protein [Emcibacteraceae bacterium]